MNSVLHIGFDEVSHSKEGLRKGFLAAGFTDYNFFNFQRVRLNEGILGCQSRMIQAAKNLMPDLIFVQIQVAGILDEETAIELSKCGFTVNYTFDVRDAEKTEWMYELAHYFNLTLFACKEDADEARRRGIYNVGNIHSSCDPDFYRPMDVSSTTFLKPEIVFIGNNYERTNLDFEKSKEREEMVNFMKAEFGERFGVFGMNWGIDSRIINPDEEVRIYNSAKIVVCHNNFLRDSYCSDRQWRAMACDVPVLIHEYPPLQIYPSRGWHTFKDLKDECVFLLSNRKEYKWLKSHMRKTFLENHTWGHRIESIKSMIHELGTATAK